MKIAGLLGAGKASFVGYENTRKAAGAPLLQGGFDVIIRIAAFIAALLAVNGKSLLYSEFVNLSQRQNGFRINSRLLAVIAMALACVGAGRTDSAERDLRRVASFNGFGPPSVSGNYISLHSSFAEMVFEEKSRKMLYNGSTIWMNDSLARSGSRWFLSRQDAEETVAPLLRPREALKGYGSMVVMLDPGHGGRDNGARSRRNILEKKATLDITRRVASRLRASGVTVRLTRSGDTYISLAERCRQAARQKADLFVSIHLNSAADRSVSGIETFIMAAPGCTGTQTRRIDDNVYNGNMNGPANMLLGFYLHSGLVACTRAEDRGLKRSRFQVLRDVTCPAVLVECGFLSNNKEETRMLDPRYRDAVAEGISRGILSYLSRVRSANPQPAPEKRPN